jgi:hypothetical protein
MQTRQELILEFMKAISAADAAQKLFEKHEHGLAATEIYLRAARLADEYISMQ